MTQKTNRQEIPYSFLVDNIKALLIFLVVFNHIIAFQLVKVDIVIRYIWYAITIFHMPAFIFVSGYLSKKPQDVMKNVKNLLIPYILGYSLTWYTQIWLGNKVDYELLRPSGTVMWYLLALFVYRLTIEALGKIRFIVPLSIIFALWAGTRPEFSTYLSTSRIVVFFPFFVAGYLWKSEYTTAVRKFKGKWVLLPIAGALLYGVPNYMISNQIPVDIFRGNHTYLVSGLSNVHGIILRLLMYLVSFVLILTFFAVLPDRKLPWTFIGKNTMGIYFFHYPILILANGLLLLKIPEMLNVWALLGVSLVIVLILGSLPVNWLYTGALNLLTFILFKKEKTVQDEGLEEEYDSDEYKYEKIHKRRKAVEADDPIEALEPEEAELERSVNELLQRTSEMTHSQDDEE
ncbi:MAG: acyltransferase family protein [Eubacteriales bacterium]|nr:acyltransferase family protein [Eubacteriales bacterium]